MKNQKAYKDRYMIGFTPEYTVLHDRASNRVIKLNGKCAFDFDYNLMSVLNDNDLYMTEDAIVQYVLKSYFDKYFIYKVVYK